MSVSVTTEDVVMSLGTLKNVGRTMYEREISNQSREQMGDDVKFVIFYHVVRALLTFVIES